MPAAFSETMDVLLARCGVELRDANAGVAVYKNWPQSELLMYFNKVSRFLYQMLVSGESDLVETGLGTFPTVVGQQEYDLVTVGLGDLWTVAAIGLLAGTFLELADQGDDQQRTNFLTSTPATGTPYEYYLRGDVMGLLPVPGFIATVKVAYYPNYVPVIITDAVPYKGLFTMYLEEAVMLQAKNRELTPGQLEAAFMDIFQTRALELGRTRRKHEQYLAHEYPV